MERMLFPAALKHTVIKLAEAVDPIPVVGGSPEDGTTTYIRVRRTGGVQMNKVQETAQFTIDVYAPADDLVEELTQEVRAHAQALAGLHFPGFNCKKYTEYSGPQASPDPESPTLSRWRFTFALHLKGTTTS